MAETEKVDFCLSGWREKVRLWEIPLQWPLGLTDLLEIVEYLWNHQKELAAMSRVEIGRTCEHADVDMSKTMWEGAF